MSQNGDGFQPSIPNTFKTIFCFCYENFLKSKFIFKKQKSSYCRRGHHTFEYNLDKRQLRYFKATYIFISFASFYET